MNRRALGSLVIVFPFFLCVAGYVSAWTSHIFSFDGLWLVLMAAALIPLAAVGWRIAKWFGVVTYLLGLCFNSFFFLTLVVNWSGETNDRLFFVLLALTSVVEVWILSWVVVKNWASIRNIRSAPEAIRSGVRSITRADVRGLIISALGSILAWAIIAALTHPKPR